MPWSPNRRPSVFSPSASPSVGPISGAGFSGGGFATGGSSGGSTRVGTNDPQYNEFPTGPFIPAPAGAATSGTSSLQRAFPERIGGSLLATPNEQPSLIEQAMVAQSRVGAQPIAIADTILGGRLKTAAQDINDSTNGIIGGILGFAGGAVEHVFSLPAALMNSAPSQVMSKVWNLTDDTVLTPEILAKAGIAPTMASQFKKNGLPVLGWLGLTGDQMTVGDLKRELEGRNFLTDPETGQQITWEEFAHNVDNDPLGAFKQGHAAVNESAVSDFLLQSAGQAIELAPLGWIGAAAKGVGLGLRGVKAAEEIDLAAKGLGTVARVAGRTEPVLDFGVPNVFRMGSKVGDGAVRQMAEESMIDVAAKSVADSAVELAAGSARGASMKGWAQFAKNALYPKIPGLNPVQRYLVGQTGVRTALWAGEGLTSEAESMLGGGKTDVPLVSNMHDFFESVMNDSIVSDDAAFSTLLAFQYPVREGLKRTPVGAVVRPAKAFLVDRGVNATMERALTDLDKEFGAGMVEKLGGREEAARWMDRVAQTMAFENLTKGLPEGIRTRWESIPEASVRMKVIHSAVRAKAEFMIRMGQITGHDLVQKFRDIHENPIRSIEREDGTMYREPILPFRTRLSADAIAKRANSYVAASKAITDPIVGMQTAVLGRAPFMAREDLDFAIQMLKDSAVKGEVDSQFIRDLFYDTPGLLDDPMVTAETHQFFVDAMNPANNKMWDAEEVAKKLGQLKPPTRDDLWHELYARDAAAPAPVADDIGPVSNGVARNIHSEATAKRFVSEADSRIRVLRQDRVSLMERYRSMFSKRGRIKPSTSDLNWRTRAPEIDTEMGYKPVEHYSSVSGKPRSYQRGYDVPGDRIGVVPIGDPDGMVAAARAVREEFPGADVRLTPSVDHPGTLDVTGSYHFTNEAAAQAKAAELNVSAYFDSSKAIEPRVPANPPIVIPKVAMDAKIAEITSAMPNLTPEQAEAAGELLRVMATNHARYNGGSPLDYIDDLEFQRGGRRGAGALRQIETEFANVLEGAGHGPSSQFKTVMDTAGRQLEVPTGTKPLSLDDAWKIKMQGINPSKLSDGDVTDLYRRTFEAHKGDPMDPVDNFRRFAFSMLSPNNNLTSNEIGFSALGVRNFSDIKRIAAMTDDEIVRTIMDVNAGFKSVGAQGKAVRDLARKLVDEPDLLNMLPGESPADYITRVSKNAGLNMKTANFAAMLADPTNWPIGTVDVHVARSLLSGELSAYLKPEDWPPGLREKYLRTATTTVTRSGREVTTYKQPGPKGKNTFTGSDYEKFNQMLELAISRKYGDLPFRTAGAQWMHWDEVRGRYEPHTAVWPKTGNLPHITEIEVYKEAKAAHVRSNYANPNVEGVEALPPQARFFQQGEGVTKGSIEWNDQMKTIIRGYKKADLSTFVHEMGHQLRRDLHPDDQIIAEMHYGVKDGNWTRRHEEQFSRDFERYLRDGRAPTDAIRDVFSKIATWMRDIYASLKGTPLEKEVSPEIRKIFDRALGKVDEPARIEMPGSPINAAGPDADRFIGKPDGTYNRVTGKAVTPRSGYAVGGNSPDTAHVGVWTDPVTGKVWIDNTVIVKDLDEALALGRQNGELAIWDFAKNEEVRTGVGDPILFEREDPALLMEREAMRDQIREVDRQINRTKNDIAEVRARAKALKGNLNNLDDTFRDMNADGSPKANNADVKRIKQYTDFVRENYPMFQVEAGPRMMNLYEPDSNFIKNLMLENDATAHYLFNWGPASRMQSAIRSAVDAAIRPVRGRAESNDTTSRIYEVLMKLGASQPEVDRFLENVNNVLLNERTIGLKHEQLPITRGMNAMGARQLTQQAIEAMSTNTKFLENFEKRYGGKGLERMYVPISEAYNPVVRAIQRKIEQGGRVNRALRLMESAYDAYHTAPGFASMAVTTHAIAKWFYPLIRFTANPLYHVYNSTEADIIALTQDGMRVRRGRTPTSAEVFRTVERGNPEARAGLTMQERRMRQMGLDPKLDAYTDELVRNATLDQTGVTFGYNSRRAALMERQVDLARPETIKDAIRQFSAEDPAVRAALKRYGGDIDDWVDGLTQDIYGIDKDGARKYIADLISEQGWTRDEFVAMQPLVNEITNKMQKSFDDIYQMHVGNINRSRIERVLNSYWLFWPASYMLKANKWMFKVLTEGAFGKKTNLGGAYTLNQLADIYHQRYTQDDDFRQLVDDNKDLMFMLSSILPVAPWSDGVSLNRLARYMGGTVGLWPQYTNFDLTDVSSWSAKMSDIGPVYAFGLAGDVSKNIAKDLDWEGGPLGILQSSQPETPQNPLTVPGL